MKNHSLIVILSLLTIAFLGCKKDDGPSIDDNFLNYKIEDIAPTKNYTLGAFYTNFGTSFNPNIKDVPTVGKYSITTAGVLSPAIAQQQIEMVKKAKIDYLIFSIRSANRALTQYRTDSTVIASFLASPNFGDVNFALSYSFVTGSFSNTTTNPIETNAILLEAFYKDFERLASFMRKANYMKVNGKQLLIIDNAYNLSANSNAAVYTEMRRRMSLLGFDLYIVGMQNKWSPPQRYYFRFVDCVDAMYEAQMVQTGDVPDRVYLFPQYCDQNWKYWKQSLKANNIDFIPSISPGYDYKILAPTSLSINVLRDNGNFYKSFCNVAKLNAPDNGLIFIETFNGWTQGTQIEPAEGYGELYLDITKQQFKIN